MQSRAVRGAAWTAMSTVGTVTVATVANVLIGRLLGAARYGNVALLTLSLGVALVVTNGGSVSAAIQWGSQRFSDGDERGALRLLSVSNGWHVYVQAPLMTVVVMSIAWHESWLVKGALLVGVIVPCIVSGAAVDLFMEHRTDAGAKVALGCAPFVQAIPVIVAYCLAQRGRRVVRVGVDAGAVGVRRPHPAVTPTPPRRHEAAVPVAPGPARRATAGTRGSAWCPTC